MSEEEIVIPLHPIRVFLGRPGVLPGLSAIASGLVVGLVTYKVTVSRLASRYEAQAEADIAEMREHYESRNKEGKFADPIQAADHLAVKVEDLGYASPPGAHPALAGSVPARTDPRPPVETIVEETITVEQNIFHPDNSPVPHPGSWTYEDELEARKSSTVYILSKEEFMVNENEWEQSTLTYFAGDGVLADSTDEIVQDEDAMVGASSLHRFGDGSGDPNIVYVRNERLEMEFEILHSDHKYNEQVLGYIEHSVSRKTRPFRVSDE